MPTLRDINQGDLAAVSALAIRSKASRGYDAATMEVFAAELTLKESDLETLTTAQVLLDAAGNITGYYTLREHSHGTTELEHLFVDPDYFGEGIGSRLLQAAIEGARTSGARELTIISDPNSLGFYLKHGGEQAGEHQSSIPGRTIPIVRIAMG